MDEHSAGAQHWGSPTRDPGADAGAWPLLGPWDITGRVRRRLGPVGPRQTLPSPSPDAALGFLLLSDLTLRQAGNATLNKGSSVQRKEISNACGAVFFEEMFSRYL